MSKIIIMHITAIYAQEKRKKSDPEEKLKCSEIIAMFNKGVHVHLGDVDSGSLYSILN